MKKGFTLVELAIVIVIIGIIMGMALKGKSLIDVARFKAELAKIVNLNTKWVMFDTKFNKLPDADHRSWLVDRQKLLDSQIFSINDFTSKLGNYYLIFVYMEKNNSYFDGNYTTQNKELPGMAHIDAVGNYATANPLAAKFRFKTYCMFELALDDDRSTKDGNVRYHVLNSTYRSGNSFNDCENSPLPDNIYFMMGINY